MTWTFRKHPPKRFDTTDRELTDRELSAMRRYTGLDIVSGNLKGGVLTLQHRAVLHEFSCEIKFEAPK